MSQRTRFDASAERHRVRAVGGIPLSPEIFEKINIVPESQDHGDLKKKLGNPTSVGYLAFVVCLTPLAMDLMGWRGAGGSGAAQVASFYFIGGMLSLIAGILEFILGNTFPFVVFTSYAGYWFSLGGTLSPGFNAAGAYSISGHDAKEGGASVGFNASFGFYILTWALLTFIFLICSLRTNIANVLLFLFLDITFCLLTGVYFNLASGNPQMATSLLRASGTVAMLSCNAGWYILVALLLESLDFPVKLPMGDLSKFITSASEIRARRKESLDYV